MATLVAGLEDNGNDGDDTLQKEVEEENGGSAAEQAVEHKEDFPSNGGRSGHPKPLDAQKHHGINRNLRSFTSLTK